MNCLNCAKYLREAMDSVFAQTYTDWEIIFWDNGSCDDSSSIAKCYGERVRYFKSDQVHPLGKARNLALEKAHGKYIAFLDCDDIWMPTKLEKQIPILESNSKVGAVFSNALYFADKGVSFRLYGKKKPPQDQIFRELLTRDFLCMATVVIRKAGVLELGEWFDERFNIIEDGDLFLRLAYNWKFQYVDEVLTLYRIHNQSWTSSKKELLPREKEMMINKFCQLYPDFEYGFKDELETVNAKIQYQYALLDWERGNRGSVRRRLRPYLWKNKKYFAPYLLSAFPYLIYRGFLKTISKFARLRS